MQETSTHLTHPTNANAVGSPSSKPAPTKMRAAKRSNPERDMETAQAGNERQWCIVGKTSPQM